MRFYINSLCVEIQYSFLLIIAFSICFEIYDYLFVFLFSMLHELGHLVTLYIVGGKADKITLAYYGIGLKHSSKLSNAKEILFLSSGIFVNLIFVLFNFKKDINLALFIINALPIYPLDGGRVFKNILNCAFDIRVSNFIYYLISFVILAFMACYALYLKNISLLFIVVYIVVYMLNNSVN